MWCPDLSILRIVRVNRDEAEIEAFTADLLAFDKTVEGLREKLRAIRAEWGTDDEPAAPTPAPSPPAPVQQAVAPDALPELF